MNNMDVERRTTKSEQKESVIQRESIYSWNGFIRRFKRSRVSLFFHFTDNDTMYVEDVDSFVNMLTLVNTLILSLPFGILTSLQIPNWNAMYDEYKNNCNFSESEAEINFNVQYKLMSNFMLSSVYVPLKYALV